MVLRHTSNLLSDTLLLLLLDDFVNPLFIEPNVPDGTPKIVREYSLQPILVAEPRNQSILGPYNGIAIRK